MDDKAKYYREQAAKLRKIADSTTDDTTRKNLLRNMAEYEQMARSLDAVLPTDRAHPKHPHI